MVGGANATLSVGISSSACSPLTYERFHNGTLVVGATSSALQLTGVHLADAGQYTAIVANNVASVSSSAATLTVQEVATPVFSPPAGSTGPQDITMTCATPGATIHYTTDGTDPTESSPSGSVVHVIDDITLKAKAWKTGWAPSEIESGSYFIENQSEPPTVTISPPTGTTILASDDLQVLVEASDAYGTITKIQLLCAEGRLLPTGQIG